MSRIEILQQENSVLLNNIPIVSGKPLDTQTIVYDDSAKQWIFANVIPGNTGPVGPTGPSTVGPAGPTGRSGGPVGPVGLTGPTGISSIVGATGPIGITGPTGASPVNGTTGPAGPTGSSALSAGNMGFNADVQTLSVVKGRVAFDTASYQFNLDGNCSYDEIARTWSLKGGKAFLCTAILGNTFIDSTGPPITRNLTLSWARETGAGREYFDGKINVSNDVELCYVVTSVIDTSTGPKDIFLEVESINDAVSVTIGSALGIGGAVGYITEL